MVLIEKYKVENKLNKIFKKFLIIAMIITSIFSYIPIASFAENNNDSSDDNLYPALVPAFADAIISKYVNTNVNGGSSGSNGDVEVITDNSATGDGWDSITTVTYPNGIKRTYRNYKQYKGSYAGNPYWDGTIYSDGCGPSAIAIALSGYMYNDNPQKVIEKMDKIEIHSTSPELLRRTLAEAYNIDVKLEQNVSRNSIDEIQENFNAGRPVIVGSHGHYVTYLGLNDSGELIESDPGDSYKFDTVKTLEDLVSYASDGCYILIKTDGNATQSNSNTSNSTSASSKNTYTSSSSGEGNRQECEVSNGAYDAIYTSGTTGRQFREFKQDANYNYPEIYYGCSWGSECGTVATGIVGSGYKTLTIQDIADELNRNYGATNFPKFLKDFCGQDVQQSSISSPDELANAIANGSVAVIHACGYSTRGHYLAILDISKDKSQVYVSNPDIYGGNGISQGWNSINDVYDALCVYNPNAAPHPGKNEVYFVTNDGSAVDYTGEGVGRNIAEDKIFYIGDSWMVGLNLSGKAKSSSSYFYAEGGMNADWVLNTYSSMNIPNDASCIVVKFGLNGLTNWKKTQELVDKLKENYSEKEIFVLQTPHICDGYTYDSSFNSKVDEYNKHMREYCEGKNGVTFINPTTNIVSDNGEGYLKNEYALDSSDTSIGGGKIHLNNSGYGVWYEDIIKCIKENTNTVGNLSSSSIDMSKNIIERKNGNPDNGYKINIDLNAEVENLLQQLEERGYHLENYLSTKNQKKYFKNMIKAAIVTQYPDLRTANDIANNKPIGDDEVQGCIKIKRYADGETEAFASGSLTNPKDKNDEDEGMYLAYMPYENFTKMINETDKNALNYFTMDSSNNIVVAGWETMEVEVDGPNQTNIGEVQNGVTIDEAPEEYRYEYTPKQEEYSKLTTKNINYLSQVSNYMMPFNLMWTLLVYGHNDDFVNEIANLVIDTKIVIGCYDATNVRVTTIKNNYEVKGVAYITISTTDESSETPHAVKKEELEPVDVIYKYEVTETDTLKTDTPNLKLIYADTWTAVYKNNYKIKTETISGEEQTAELEDKTLQYGDKALENDNLKDMVDQTIDEKKDEVLEEAIRQQREAADKENEKIDYKYNALQTKIIEYFADTDLASFLLVKDVQSNVINMITRKDSKKLIESVFNEKNDLMVKYAKKYGDYKQILNSAVEAVYSRLMNDEDLYNEITKNGTDFTLAVIYTSNIESIDVRGETQLSNQEESIKEETTTSTLENVPSDDSNVRWKTNKNATEDSFVKVLSKNVEAKTNLHGVSGWFFESMEHTASIADLLDLMKMLFQFVYEEDYGITDEDEKALLDLFDPEKFQYVGKEGSTTSGEMLFGKISAELLDFIAGGEGGDQYIHGDQYEVFYTAEDGCLNLPRGIVVKFGDGSVKFPDLVPNPYSGQMVSKEIYDKCVEKTYNTFISAVDAAVEKYGVTLKQYQYDALVSMCYNLGGGVADTFVGEYARGGNEALWAELKQYTHANGVELLGLKRRRSEEYELFTTGDYKYDPDWNSSIPKYY